jgi:hypothetical protein
MSENNRQAWRFEMMKLILNIIWLMPQFIIVIIMGAILLPFLAPMAIYKEYADNDQYVWIWHVGELES